jgi:hypothetical protein
MRNFIGFSDSDHAMKKQSCQYNIFLFFILRQRRKDAVSAFTAKTFCIKTVALYPYLVAKPHVQDTCGNNTKTHFNTTPAEIIFAKR